MFTNPLRFPVLVFTCLFLILPDFSFAVEISQGTMLANSCAACHGTDGDSPGAIPSIKGKSTDFIVTNMKDFASGKRPSTVMGRHAKGYSDQELQMIAEFFGRRAEK